MTDIGLNALEVMKHTPRTNCGECGVPNCMAFAALAVAGQKQPGDCPYLGDEIKERIAGHSVPGRAVANDRPEYLLDKLRARVRDLDLAEAAERLGGRVTGGRFEVRCLGKLFEVDREGVLHSECHVNNWIHVSVLQYLVQGRGLDPAGDWVTFRELKEAKGWERFFNHRCEKALHQMSDDDPVLFLDILELFGKAPPVGAPAGRHAYLLYPLPKVPFLVCYSPAEGKFESTLSVFFDRTIEDNLKAEGTYLMAQGIVEMFKRISERHGWPRT